MIFEISIKNWVELGVIERFSATLFFVEKFNPGPPQGPYEK
jgi:hypothetical protein